MEVLMALLSVGGGPAAFGIVSFLMWHNGPKQAIEKLSGEVTELTDEMRSLLDKHNDLDKRTVRLETLAKIE